MCTVNPLTHSECSYLDPDQYTAIPLPAKIIKLLVSDATNAYMSEQVPAEDAESVEDDVCMS